VVENPSQGTFNGVTYPALETDYFYDALGNLYCVQQKGTAASGTVCPASPSATNPFSSLSSNNYRGRWFVYDSLSRLTDAYNPETGHTSWSYDANGNVLTKTDGKGQTVTYGYDAENRVISKQYSAGDHAVTYGYDTSTLTCPSGTTNPIDHRTSMTDASGTTKWAFDERGRQCSEQQTIGTVTKTNSTQHNLLGLPTVLTYPNGDLVAFGYSGAGWVSGSRSPGHRVFGEGRWTQ
jgi:YD repeat-containing protein